MNKLVRLTKPLAEALAKGAHRKETTQQKFMVDAIAKALVDLDDEKIQALVASHDSLTEEKGTPNHA